MNNLGADRSTCRKACVCISLSSCKTDVKCDSKGSEWQINERLHIFMASQLCWSCSCLVIRRHVHVYYENRFNLCFLHSHVAHFWPKKSYT